MMLCMTSSCQFQMRLIRVSCLERHLYEYTYFVSVHNTVSIESERTECISKSINLTLKKGNGVIHMWIIAFHF